MPFNAYLLDSSRLLRCNAWLAWSSSSRFSARLRG